MPSVREALSDISSAISHGHQPIPADDEDFSPMSFGADDEPNWIDDMDPQESDNEVLKDIIQDAERTNFHYL